MGTTQKRISVTWSAYATGVRIRELMREPEAPSTLVDLSLGAQLPYPTVQKYREGAFLPHGDDLRALADALGVTPEGIRVVDLAQAPGRKATHASADAAARLLAQAGWAFGFEPVEGCDPSGEPGVGIVATGNQVGWLLREWAERYRYDLEAREEDGSEEARRRNYRLWRCRLGMGEGPKGAWDVGDADLPPSLAEARRREAAAIAEASLSGEGRDFRRREYARRLKALRREAGLSQAALAKASGVKVATIQSYETARSMPKTDVNEALAAALGVSTASLIVYELDSPLAAVHALMDIADYVGLAFDVRDPQPVLVPVTALAARVLTGWHRAWSALREGDTDAMRSWWYGYDDARVATRWPAYNLPWKGLPRA